MEQGKLDSAMVYQQVLLTDSTQNPSRHAIDLENMALMKLQVGRVQESLADYEIAMEAHRSIGEVSEMSYSNIAEIAAMAGNLDRSKKYYDSAIATAKRRNNGNVLKDFYAAAAQVYRASQQLPVAMQMMDSALLYDARQDSAALLAKMHDIETQYGVQIKDEQLQVETATNAKRVTIIIGLIITLALGAIIAVLLLRRQKLKRLLSEYQLEQRLLRTQMEPHFIFNALTQLQHLIFSNNTEKSLRYLTQFSRLLRISLVNARESFVPLEKEIDALQSYLTLQQLNFEDRFSFDLDIYEGIRMKGC
ncbi:histidine kinase [Chitinophaga sedimenti]|uniref:histidine kinase n=1 Tax=Chitinophaga sedimenti TaxID=2033606 RepID=UPI0020057DD0|nr:histidine kinase [Chitinophaga sedimenti]MCK7559383.1 histidine kinase [Chitinophaga sedimenti]